MSKKVNGKPAKKCIFCGAGNLSKEHFWPEWAAEILPNFPINQREERLYTFTQLTTLKEPPKILTRPGYAKTKKIRAVCASCNNGWMSILETSVRPILTPLIKGEPFTFNDSSAKILAQWIALKVMVGEHNQPDEMVTKLPERETFKSSLEIPPGLKIWIAKCGVGGWETSYVRHAATVSRTPTPLPEHRFKNIHTVTFGIGNLMIHVFHSTVANLDNHFDISHPGIVQLYPFKSEIMWPLTKNLSIEDARFVANTLDQWLKLSIVGWRPVPAEFD